MEVRVQKKPKNMITKTISYWRKNGARKCAKKVYNKLFRLEEVSYEKWRKGALPTSKQLEEQKRRRFEREPLISIVVPLYHTPAAYFLAMVESVQSQTYGNWELCLADGGGRSVRAFRTGR